MSVILHKQHAVLCLLTSRVEMFLMPGSNAALCVYCQDIAVLRSCRISGSNKHVMLVCCRWVSACNGSIKPSDKAKSKTTTDRLNVQDKTALEAYLLSQQPSQMNLKKRKWMRTCWR